VNDRYKLEDLRKVRLVPQAVLAEKLGMRQASLSQMERRKVLQTDSLQKYVERLGGRLSIIAEFSDGKSYRLTPFSSNTLVSESVPHQLPERTFPESPPDKLKSELRALLGDPAFLEVLDKVLGGALTEAVQQYEQMQKPEE
jgi:transcriptional regulator with XRE-family HTH domain